ncbi:hypothetical protein B7R22_17240 [Subtercola boreus]|uniref:DUF4214 domain-containing protein n=1 Tax=Subtercola boreus TaxID=120213 RepID=A0A3E0VS05_9MICO|nr:hypothetical protein [Subtercola boreus]RFA12173.1 hypothetical protein B7R22_17240 [Subtercola boreus]
MPAWGGFRNGYVPIDALVFVDGVWLEPEFGARVSLSNEDLRADGYWVIENEGDRPLGIPSDMLVRDASKTSTGGSNQWYQWGRKERDETPEAADPTQGEGTSEHGWAMADDSNSNNPPRRKAISATYGCVYPIASETWHRQPRYPLSGAIAARVEARKQKLLGNNTPTPPQEEDIMASLAEVLEGIRTENDPILKILQNLVSTPEQDRDFIELLNKIYKGALDRDADGSAIGTYLPLLRTGAINEAGINAAIVASLEYKRRFIQVLYADPNVLNRTAGPAEVEGWANSGLTLDGIRAAVLGSAEYKSKH